MNQGRMKEGGPGGGEGRIAYTLWHVIDYAPTHLPKKMIEEKDE